MWQLEDSKGPGSFRLIHLPSLEWLISSWFTVVPSIIMSVVREEGCRGKRHEEEACKGAGVNCGYISRSEYVLMAKPSCKGVLQL